MLRVFNERLGPTSIAFGTPSVELREKWIIILHSVQAKFIMLWHFERCGHTLLSKASVIVSSITRKIVGSKAYFVNIIQFAWSWIHSRSKSWDLQNICMNIVPASKGNANHNITRFHWCKYPKIVVLTNITRTKTPLCINSYCMSLFGNRANIP